jgi:hypothetical protein
MGTPGYTGEEARGLPAIREVKARHEDLLLSIPGVVSVGVGMGPDGTPAIIVGLDRHRPEAIEKIPEELEGYPVHVEMVGRLRAL